MPPSSSPSWPPAMWLLSTHHNQSSSTDQGMGPPQIRSLVIFSSIWAYSQLHHNPEDGNEWQLSVFSKYLSLWGRRELSFKISTGEWSEKKMQEKKERKKKLLSLWVSLTAASSYLIWHLGTPLEFVLPLLPPPLKASSPQDLPQRSWTSRSPTAPSMACGLKISCGETWVNIRHVVTPGWLGQLSIQLLV